MKKEKTKKLNESVAKDLWEHLIQTKTLAYKLSQDIGIIQLYLSQPVQISSLFISRPCTDFLTLSYYDSTWPQAPEDNGGFVFKSNVEDNMILQVWSRSQINARLSNWNFIACLEIDNGGVTSVFKLSSAFLQSYDIGYYWSVSLFRKRMFKKSKFQEVLKYLVYCNLLTGIVL